MGGTKRLSLSPPSVRTFPEKTERLSVEDTVDSND